MNIDFATFNILNSLAGKNYIADRLFIFFAVYLTYLFVAAVILYWLRNKHKLSAHIAVIHSFTAFVLSRLVIVEIIRWIWHRPRPFLAARVVELFPKGNEASFPSGHAAALFAIATSIYFYDKKLGAALLVASALISISRVISGVHYPGDILAGAVIGILIAWTIKKCFGTGLYNFASRLSAGKDLIKD